MRLVSFFRPLDTKLPPRAAFTSQIIGTLLGSILNYSSSLFSGLWDCSTNAYQL